MAEMFIFSFDNCLFFLTSTTTFADTWIAPFSATNSCQLLLAILNILVSTFDNCFFFLTGSATTSADTWIAPFSATNSCQIG
jgi:hypothetical protein